MRFMTLGSWDEFKKKNQGWKSGVSRRRKMLGNA
jgi:hypothetical protein